MGLFGGSKSSEAASENPEIRQVEQMVATEAKNEQKNLDHTLKDFAKLNGTHEKAIKVCLRTLSAPGLRMADALVGG